MDEILFVPSLIYTQYPIMTRQLQVFRNVCKSIQTLCDETRISGAFCFRWSSLRCFYNSIVWTWFGKAYTCLYKVPQLRANTKPLGRRNTGLCQETDLGKGTKKCLQHGRSLRTQWHPSFLNGRSLELPRLFLERAGQPNWAIGWERPWSGRWPRTWWSLWVPLWRWENLPEGQPSLTEGTPQ